MKTVKLSILIASALTTLILTPVYADSNSFKKEQRYEQRRDEGKKRHQNKPQKQYKQQQKNSRAGNKNLHPKQRKQDFRETRQPAKQKNHQDHTYTTRRYDSQPNRGYSKRHRVEKYQRNHRRVRPVTRHYNYRDHRRNNRHYELRHGNRLLLATPRHRTFRNVFIVRPFGHSYFGYGHYLSDNNAWRWLTFTAITLKLLDMVDEQAQRKHEEAQIEATNADVGEKIYWDTDEASGYVVTTRQGRNRSGLTCREYQHSITVGGETEEAYGTACLQADGSWKIVN